MIHDPITFTWVHSFKEFTDFEAYVEGIRYQLTFVEGGEPYIVKFDEEARG